MDTAPLTPTEIELRWTGRPGAYEVFSDGGTGLGVLWLKTKVQGNFYRDSGLSPGGNYTYRVRPVRGDPSRERAARTASVPQPSAVVQQPVASPVAAAIPDVPSPKPTATSVPADTILLGLMSSNDYVDDIGELVVVGVVRNDAQKNATDARVILTLYDVAGEVIDEVTGSPLITLLKPGQRSPFVLSLPRPENLREWSLRVTARPTQQQAQDGLTIISSHGSEDRTGFYHVSGTVINGGSRATRLAQVVVTLYDQWGKIINAGFAYTDPSSVQIGSEAEFDCSFNYFPRVADFSIQLEWD